MKDKLGQESAYPDPMRGVEQSIGNQTPEALSTGMSKRFYAACAAMQGMITNFHRPGEEVNYSEISAEAYKFADELLKQESDDK